MRGKGSGTKPGPLPLSAQALPLRVLSSILKVVHLPTPTSEPQRIHHRLRRLLIVVFGPTIVAIVISMWATEQLSGTVRWPIVGLLLCLIVWVFALVIRRQVAAVVEKPLAQSVEVAEAIAGGESSRLVPRADTLEFDQLATSINRMTEQMLAATQARLRVEKLATMGRIAAGISHEIGNPVAAIANYTHVLRMRTDGVPGTSEPLDALEREISRIDRIMRGLLDYARPRRLTPKPIAVDDVVVDVLRLLSDQGVTRRFRITHELEAPEGLVYAERHDLEQVFVNLLLNSIDAMDRDGEIVISSRINDAAEFAEFTDKRRSDPMPQRWRHRPSKRAMAWLARPETPEKFLQIVIADSGTGVAPEDEERIFEPFFSTKQPGKGTGLGLAIVASTIENLGGTVWVQRAREGGAAFIILLPLHEGGLRAVRGAEA